MLPSGLYEQQAGKPVRRKKEGAAERQRLGRGERE